MNSQAGSTRREVLKKGAVAGAIVWTAPILSSSPAFAATGACSGSKPCTDFYFMQSTGGTNCAGTDGSCTYPTVTDCDENPVTLQSGCTLGANKPVVTNGGNSGSIVFPAGVVPIYINAKLGSTCYLMLVNDDGLGNLTLGDPSVTPAPCNGVTYSLQKVAGKWTFTINVEDTSNCSPGAPNGQGLSHLATAFCL